MGKRRIYLFIILICAISLSGCSRKVKLNFAFGERTGTYSGDMTDGVPNGNGKFIAQNDNGAGWTYEGNWANGHFNGEGKTTWKSGQIEIGTYKNDVIVPMAGDAIKTLYTSPEEYKDHVVEVMGKVFTAPEYEADGVSIQMWGDAENSDNNIIVYIPDANFKVNTDDYIKIIGSVGDVIKGTNAFGAERSAPSLIAKEYSIISYQDALSPAKNEIKVNQKQTQFGYSITIQKIELADKETRVYVKVDNNGRDKFSVYSFNAMIVQNNKQYEKQDNWNADYPEIQTDLMVGNSTEGIISFPKLEEAPFEIIFEGSSDNWNEKLEDYKFDIKF